MIRAAGDRIEVSDAMTLLTATDLLASGKALLAGTQSTVDLAAVTDVDSSALAVIFAWLREARRLGKHLTIIHVPQDLLSLADVYGVTELLPLAVERSSAPV
jgi:phospholipid transport system transporter-binding protein